MNLEEVVLPRSPPELSHGFDKGCAFDITHRATELDNASVWLLARIIDWNLSDPLDPVLDGVRQMGHHLHCSPEVITPPFAFDDMLVDLAGCDVVLPRQGNVEISLVVAQVKIDLTAVVQHEHLPMSVAP